MIFWKFKLVIVFGGRGPLQPLIAVELFNKFVVPSYISKVPQNAKDVRVEPVVLLIDNVNVLVIVVPGVHELQAFPPVSVAPTIVRSFDTHEDAGGKFCDTAAEIRKILDNTSIIRENNICFFRLTKS